MLWFCRVRGLISEVVKAVAFLYNFKAGFCPNLR